MATAKQSGKKRIGFVSTRIAGTDGVSLEARKWIDVLSNHGHECFVFAGESDFDESRTYLVPEAHFQHDKVRTVQDASFYIERRDEAITQSVQLLKEGLKHHLRNFIALNHIDLLVIQNAVTIPMNIPLGLAITEIIAETALPTIAHHHDFFWERDRFLVNCVNDYLSAAFPPNLPSIRHVTINSVSAREFSYRTGAPSIVVPNVMDFESPPSPLDRIGTQVRHHIGVADGELMVLQPTRIVKRKRVEQAIDLVRRLNLKAVLVVTHPAGDEGKEYEVWLKEYARVMKVRVLFVADQVAPARNIEKRHYTLQDMYQNADFVTYPSGQEGFGNALIEAFYYRKPVVVNKYSTYQTDIAPKGFEAVEIDGFVTEEALRQKREVLTNSKLRTAMVRKNYELGRQHFSYRVLWHRLQHLLEEFFGEEVHHI